jgi:hypothetical protein
LAYNYENGHHVGVIAGLPKGTAGFAAAPFNKPSSEGIVFATLVYTTFSSASDRKWESCQRLDPYSYSNRATPASLYNECLHLGLFISEYDVNVLDVGRIADGTIVGTKSCAPAESGHLDESGFSRLQPSSSQRTSMCMTSNFGLGNMEPERYAIGYAASSLLKSTKYASPKP